jgi:hypothetical protein
VGHLAAHVDRIVLLADRVEILGIGLPAPGDALGQGGTGDVLDPFHQLDQPVLAAWAHRSETHATVAGDHCRDAVPAGRLERAVPAHLTVIVGVDVHETGGYQVPGRVDGLGRLAGQRRVVRAAADNVDDFAVLDADVGAIAFRARAVHNGATDDFQVEHECLHGKNQG